MIENVRMNDWKERFPERMMIRREMKNGNYEGSEFFESERRYNQLGSSTHVFPAETAVVCIT
jgi:hypothetical protein